MSNRRWRRTVFKLKNRRTPISLKARTRAESDRISSERIKTNEPFVYAPHWITGGAKHPGLIVETSGLANVAPPLVNYRPYLPKILSDNSILSAIQIERVIYAGQAHSQLFSNGARAGISIGDETETGKTLDARRNNFG